MNRIDEIRLKFEAYGKGIIPAPNSKEFHDIYITYSQKDKKELKQLLDTANAWLVFHEDNIDNNYIKGLFKRDLIRLALNEK